MGSHDIECKGCTAHNTADNNIQCVTPPEYKNTYCPCLTCIVKMVCTKTAATCKELSNYMDNISMMEEEL